MDMAGNDVAGGKVVGTTGGAGQEVVGSSGHSSTLNEFLHVFLQRKYRSHGLLVEQAYNVMEGLRMYVSRCFLIWVMFIFDQISVLCK
jgi:hypothetical protein